MITLSIFSDPICPWCYIGKARLDAALESRPEHPFRVEWHPFMLNPDMPEEGMDRIEYLETKFGPRENLVKAYLPVQEAAEQAGLPFDLSRITRTPNTLNAHRLIHWAGLEGRQTALVSALFRAYFADGVDIGAAEALVSVAERAGMDGDVTRRLLASDADRDQIIARDREIRARGLTGVPGFVIDGEHVLVGAQPVHVWQSVIDQLGAPRP